MVTFIVLAVILGILLIAVSGVCALLLDPLIAIFAIYGIYKFVRWCINKYKK